MNAIVAVDANWAIGAQGDLLFSLPTDMKRFRTITSGGTVILGRKTLDSFPGGKPLPHRRNIVISRNLDLTSEGAERVSSPEEALALAEGDENVWVIGGGSVYTALLSRCERVLLTKVDSAAPEVDTFFPNLDKLPNWKVESVSEPIVENGLTYRFIDYVNTAL
ncbi:MAG: dihydrofolate reductase [Oscillibacter sp.]|nr:dihydrofolate reductase [Oscillibacter sp.]MBQ2996475.1 dihydrofolate reductase [Oscillibacter sp.]